jgi:branched-chain amino acid transport system substrate-binding protein
MTKTGTPFSFGAVGVEPMAKAVYDRVNADGGIQGRKIQLVVADDQNTPQGATQAARKLVQQDNVVAFAPSASYVDCTANKNFYVQQKVLSLEFSADPECYDSPNNAPVNPGPFVDTTLTLLYGHDKLGLTKQCIIQGVSATRDKANVSLDQYEKISGDTMPYRELSVPPNVTDFTPYLLKAKAKGCESVTTPGGSQQAPAFTAQMKAQGMQNTVLMLSGGSLDPAIAKAVAKNGIKQAYAPSEFEPFGEPSEANADWEALANANKVPINTFTQGAYLAATYMVDVLKSIKGNIDRESVTKALYDMKPISNPMVGTPFRFGKSKNHVANRSVRIMKLDGGAWVPAEDTFTSLPAQG